MRSREKVGHIADCLELAILLEVSAHKPGNVSVVTNFENTRYEHFLASAVAAKSSFRKAAEQGVAVTRGEKDLTNVGIGRIVLECVTRIESWQHGGNTLLGTVLLLTPMAAAAGMSGPDNDVFEITELRENLRLVVESTRPEDAVNVYRAIAVAKPSGLGKAPDLDVHDPSSSKRILSEGITLYEVFKIAEKYDNICYEWVNDFPITFDCAYPYLVSQIQDGGDLNAATIETFLKVLAEYPDTFIARKAGLERAKEVSSSARKILELGGVETRDGKQALADFDQKLRREDSLLNPGTTADMIAAALALCVLGGFRP